MTYICRSQSNTATPNKVHHCRVWFETCPSLHFNTLRWIVSEPPFCAIETYRAGTDAKFGKGPSSTTWPPAKVATSCWSDCLRQRRRVLLQHRLFEESLCKGRSPRYVWGCERTTSNLSLTEASPSHAACVSSLRRVESDKWCTAGVLRFRYEQCNVRAS